MWLIATTDLLQEPDKEIRAEFHTKVSAQIAVALRSITQATAVEANGHKCATNFTKKHKQGKLLAELGELLQEATNDLSQIVADQPEEPLTKWNIGDGDLAETVTIEPNRTDTRKRKAIEEDLREKVGKIGGFVKKLKTD